jgi:hypothetical protein
MVWACGMHGSQGFWCEKFEEKTGSGNKGMDGRVVLK